MRRREVPEGMRFITFSCYRRLPLLRHPAISELLMLRMQRSRERDALRVYAWVIMPEQVHVLCRPPENRTLAPILGGIKISVARHVIARWTQLGAPILGQIRAEDGPRFWQRGGGFDRNVRTDAEFAREVNYIHHNPVERGLVARPQDWECSSVHWWLGDRCRIPLTCDQRTDPAWAAWNGFI